MGFIRITTNEFPSTAQAHLLGMHSKALGALEMVRVWLVFAPPVRLRGKNPSWTLNPCLELCGQRFFGVYITLKDHFI